jgi:hypothetical protein
MRMSRHGCCCTSDCWSAAYFIELMEERGGHWRYVEHGPDDVHSFEGRYRKIAPGCSFHVFPFPVQKEVGPAARFATF